MKILITGVQGQLGSELVKLYKNTCEIVLQPTLAELDLTDLDRVKAYLYFHKPDLVLHCAAYTQVDKAETEKDLCTAINLEATKVITDYCSQTNSYLVFISTDYVFSGTGNSTWKEIDSNGPALNHYGYTKLEAEKYIRSSAVPSAIVRTQWVYSINGNNFINTILRLAADRTELKIISDQIGSPTYAPDLAKAVYQIAEKRAIGIYHAVNSGYTSWYEFADYFLTKIRWGGKVTAIPTIEYPTPAKRPINGCLDSSNLLALGIEMPSWQSGVDRFFGSKNPDSNFGVEKNG